MEVAGKTIIVTGGGHGIGRALCLKFASEGAQGIVVADIDESAARKTAEQIGGLAVPADVRDESQVANLVETVVSRWGRVDLFCSNAGIFTRGGFEVPDEDWQKIWEINALAHVYAARAAVPLMLQRGEGYMLITASAAGLLTQIGSAPYAVTKHAAVSFAEWLAVTHGDQGLKVSCLCPQGVRTRMLDPGEGRSEGFLVAGSIAPEEAAEAVVKGLSEEKFLILPHPEVREYFQRKARDYDRWLRGMRRLRRSLPEDQQ